MACRVKPKAFTSITKSARRERHKCSLEYTKNTKKTVTGNGGRGVAAKGRSGGLQYTRKKAGPKDKWGRQKGGARGPRPAQLLAGPVFDEADAALHDLVAIRHAVAQRFEHGVVGYLGRVPGREAIGGLGC